MASKERLATAYTGESSKQALSPSTPGKGSLVAKRYGTVQRRRAAGGPAATRPGNEPSAAVHQAAARGVATPSVQLPHSAAIQRSFGRHDISSVQAHLGSDATHSAADMGAQAFATGNHAVFAGAPSLHTAAHEAAHIVQQRGGVQLKGGVGSVGDEYERHADAVADLVVQGKSAESLLDACAGGSGVQASPAAGGSVQRKETDKHRETKARSAQRLARSAAFEQRLGVAAYNDARSGAAADRMLDAMLRGTVPDFDAAEAEQQDKYVALFGRDATQGAFSAGQVGDHFATVMEAVKHGNLRERMTALYNGTDGSFKAEVLNLMKHHAWDTMAARGLDVTKLRRRRNQMKYNPAARDLYRDPGNPLDRKHLKTYENRGTTRTWQGDADGKGALSARQIGDMAETPLSDREKRFMYHGLADHEIGDDKPLMWKEGGTVWQANADNKWVKKCREKLTMPVIAGPSGTALRMFQAWEFLSKPAVKEHYRLALLGWMLTGNDHSFHEIMTTSAEYGMEYQPGPMAYHHVAPFSADELRAFAGPEGFPDEASYIDDHMTPGSRNSILITDRQSDHFNRVIESGADIWASGAPPVAGELAQAMAVLMYTDDGYHGGISNYKFINNVLKGNDSKFAMLYFLHKEPQLKEAYDANKFSIKELVSEAKEHARMMQLGLKLLKPFTGPVYRGYRTNSLPKSGQTWTESKFLSMSQDPVTAACFAHKTASKGKYGILVTVHSKTGRNLGMLSMATASNDYDLDLEEGEVVFAPGTTFRVASKPAPAPDLHEDLTPSLDRAVEWEEI